MSTQPQKGGITYASIPTIDIYLVGLKGFMGHAPFPPKTRGFFRGFSRQTFVCSSFEGGPTNGMWRSDCCNVDLWLKRQTKYIYFLRPKWELRGKTRITPPWVWNFQICQALNDVRFTMTRPLADTSWRSCPENRSGVWHSMKNDEQSYHQLFVSMFSTSQVIWWWFVMVVWHHYAKDIQDLVKL